MIMKTLFSGLSMRDRIVRATIGLSAVTFCTYTFADSGSGTNPPPVTLSDLNGPTGDGPTLSCYEQWVEYWDCVFLEEGSSCEVPRCSARSAEGRISAFFEAAMNLQGVDRG